MLNRELKENKSTKSGAEVTVKVDVMQNPNQEAASYGNRIMSMLWNGVQFNLIEIFFSSQHLG